LKVSVSVIVTGKSMLPAGAESKHTATPAYTCVRTGKPKQKRMEVAGIQEEAQDYSQEKRRRNRLVSSTGVEFLIYI